MFIGDNVVSENLSNRRCRLHRVGPGTIIVASHPEHSVLNIDKLTYAGNLDNLEPVTGNPRYRFVQGDIADDTVDRAGVRRLRPEAVLHLAAESHVDRSILSPIPVFDTNLRGTFTLLEAARKHGLARFVHVSTDEVYGSLEAPDEADEEYTLRPSSPYSATKAGSDLLALSFVRPTSFR